MLVWPLVWVYCCEPTTISGVSERSSKVITMSYATNQPANEAAAPPDRPPRGNIFIPRFQYCPPKRGLLCQRRLNSGVFVLPMESHRPLGDYQQLANWLEQGCLRPATPFGLDCPVISTLSFIVTGTPCNGPICSFSRNFLIG